MEYLIKETEKSLEKIELIESFISLHLRRDQIEPQILQLVQKTEEIKQLVQQCNRLMKVEYETAMQEHTLIMQKMQEQQLQILNMLIERHTNLKVEGRSMEICGDGRTPSGILKEKQCAHKSLTHRIMKGEAVTPKMFLDEYLQSPFVRKIKPIPVPFQFLDFEVNISPEQFDTIPKYMRGRETLDELTHFLDTVLVPCFNEKYQLLHRHRDCIRNHVDLDLWKVYKDQASYFPGQNFITQGDISRKIKKMLDKKSQNKITMLRHLGILQEQRKAQTVCYIWTANGV